MMCSPVPLLLVALSTTLAAPSAMFEDSQIVVPQKRAALVLDRLLIALQKALHEDASQPKSEQLSRDWPRTAPLRIDAGVGGDMRDEFEEVRPLSYEFPDRDVPAAPLRLANDEDNDLTGLQRRGQAGTGRGRVLRCYFNAVTCF